MVDPLGILGGVAGGIYNFIVWLATGTEKMSTPKGICPAPLDNIIARVGTNMVCKSQEAFAGLSQGLGWDPGSGASLFLAGIILLIVFFFIVWILYKMFKKYVLAVIIILLILFIWRSVMG